MTYKAYIKDSEDKKYEQSTPCPIINRYMQQIKF